MTSAINPNMPVAGNPTTASVRANFATAQQEITTLQNNTQGAPFLPLAGAVMQGPITLYNDPTAPMQPVTLGYFQANGGGGGTGPAGVPEAPADGNLYGRENGSWQPAVNTAQMNAAIAAAPYLPIAGGTLTGTLVLAGPPTVALNPASKGYVDTGFLPIAGGTLTGPLILAADPTQALGAATKQYTDNQHFVPQLGPNSIGVAFIDNSTGSNRLPCLTGLITPYNAASDGLKLQAKHLSAPTATGANTDGPAILLAGASYPSIPNTITLSAGNNTAGYVSWTLGADGSLTSPSTGTSTFGHPVTVQSGRLIVNNVNNVGNPSVTIWDNSQGYAAGMFLGASASLYFAKLTGTGDLQTTFASFDSVGHFYLGSNNAINDPLNINVASGYSARLMTTVNNVRTWSTGTRSDGSYGIADETGTAVRLAIGLTGTVQVYAISFLAAYGSSNALAFGWATYSGYPSNVAVSVDNGAAVYPIASASDERIKHDIAPSSFDCLATLLKFPLVEYRWSDLADPANLGARRKSASAPLKRVGLIAQRIHEICPDVVTAGDTFLNRLGRVWTLDQNNMMALLVGAIQQLTARVATLEARGH